MESYTIECATWTTKVTDAESTKFTINEGTPLREATETIHRKYIEAQKQIEMKSWGLRGASRVHITNKNTCVDELMHMCMS